MAGNTTGVLMNRPRLEVVGTDAGGLASLPHGSRELLRQCRLVVAPRRLLADLRTWLEDPAAAATSPSPRLLPSHPLEEALPRLRQAVDAGERAVLLASGDPLWYGVGRLLLEHFHPRDLRFHPAPTALQLAFARLARPWQETGWISLHGRDPEPLLARLQQRPDSLAVLTDPARGGAGEVRRILRASGLEQSYAFWLFERLGHPDERISNPAPEDPLPQDIDPLHLVVLLAEPPPSPSAEALPLFGIEDGLWLQHGDRPGLMTKREVRIQLLAELELPETGVLWDLGAGVGSIGLEALRLRPGLALWAVDRRLGTKALISANALRLGVRPAGILEGSAADSLVQLPDPDRVLFGGGSGDPALLAAVIERLRPGGRIVIPLATLEGVGERRAALEASGLSVRISQHQAWRGTPLADGTRLAPMNPVLVVTGCGGSRHRSHGMPDES